jgi:hypothetical protein
VLAASAVIWVILVGVSSASASLVVGVNDDTPKNPPLAAWFYSTMAADGLQVDTLSLRWDDTAPTTIPDLPYVTQAIAAAAAQGVSVELDLYPLHSQAFTGGSACAPSSDPQACGNTSLIQQFGAWAASVARTFPSVRQYVVMNECNQPLFLNPQWNSSGQNQSAAICGRALASAYDALKAVNKSVFVWGVGLSPRGNDDASAVSNSSTSPVKFLAALGQWFAAFAQKTGRKAPLMDGLDFHPYPVPQSLPFATGYANPIDASVTNLPRIYQAFYSAFNGTPQKTIGQQAGGGLPVSLNETGIQTDSSAHAAAYTGSEVSATAAGGVTGDFATESYQANWYLQMLNLVACDPNVQLVNIFHLIDETSLAGWQSGLYYADQSPKQSASSVQSWVQRTRGNCTGTPTPWTPSGVPAASPTTTTPTTTATPVLKPPKPAPPKNATPPVGHSASGPLVTPPPPGCTGACAHGLELGQTGCAGKAASAKLCQKAIAALQAELVVLQKLAKHARGKAGAHVKAQLAAYKAALALAKKLVHALGTGPGAPLNRPSSSREP